MTTDIFAQMQQDRAAGKAFALATLVETAGHTPRHAGAKMIVYPDGTIVETIGGGNFERQVIDDCLALINSGGGTLLKSYLFEESGPGSTHMVCGGEGKVFMEAFAKPETLVVFGGGHVCRALVDVASGLNFRIVIVDNRPEVLDWYHSPVQKIGTDDTYLTNWPTIDKDTYVVIVTQGHKYDEQVLGQVIGHDCAYIGMIGSKKKIAHTFKALKDQGITKEQLAKVHSPIGLAIGAEGPQEIAVAIAAELIGVRRKAME
jgi:xanthine dehydrogenase accessory factor